MPTKDVKVWTGTEWQSLKGEPGPQEVSANAGNLTKLGTDGKVFTEVKASDVQGLGTIALKAEGDYLPITGGNVTGLVEVGAVAGRHIDLAPSTPNITVHGFDATAKVQLLSPTATGGQLTLLSNKTGTPVVTMTTPAQAWTLSAQTNGTMFIGSPSNPTGSPALQFTRGATDAASAVQANYPLVLSSGTAGKDIRLTPGDNNITINGFDAAAKIQLLSPTATGGQLNLLSGTSGAPVIQYVGGPAGARRRTWTSFVNNATGHFTIARDGDLGNAILCTADYEATTGLPGGPSDKKRVIFEWPIAPAGGIEDGLTFNTTSNLPSRLDAYEEGNWVPAYSGDSAIAATYTVQTGQYTRIGRLVHCTGYIQLSNVANRSTGQLRITGLPIPRQIGSGCSGTVGCANNWGVAVPVGVVNHPTDANSVLVYDAEHLLNAQPGLPIIEVTNLTDNSLLQFNITYFTNT